MGMEWHNVIEKLDSLWFFGTVFSNRTTPPANAMEEKLGNRHPTLNDVEEPSVSEEIATPISQNDQDVEILASEIETEVDIRINRSKEMEKEEKRRRSRRRKSSCLRERRKVNVGEMDLSFAVKEVCECWLFEHRIGFGAQNYQKKKTNMPPFEDSMAMKEHIRWWAYAVACTVR